MKFTDNVSCVRLGKQTLQYTQVETGCVSCVRLGKLTLQYTQVETGFTYSK
jgi:uncharacterized protein (UPF0212 family)